MDPMCAININTFFFGLNVDYKSRDLIDNYVDLHERAPPEYLICTQKPAIAIEKMLGNQRRLIEEDVPDGDKWYCVL